MSDERHRQTVQMVCRDIKKACQFDRATEAVAAEGLAWHLNEFGYVVINHYWTTEKCWAARNTLEKLEQEFSHATEEGLLSGSGALVKRRNGWDGHTDYDSGMYDIVDINKEVDLAAFESDPFIMELLQNASGKEFGLGSVNAYINNGVINTRGWHADVIAKNVYKAFLYLSDVPDESHGPYSYISGSHKANWHRYANIGLNYVMGYPKADMRLHDARGKIVFKAPEGTLIITHQRGFHRGLPQQPNHSRYLLSASYKEIKTI